MLRRPCSGVRSTLNSARKPRGLSALRASAQPQSLPQPLPIAAISAGSIPISYRAITTDPTFRPATTGCSQYAPGPPQLLGRHITLNPLHGLAAWAEERVSALDRVAAAALDDLPLAQAAAAAATAALTYWGLHPLSLLTRGLPAALVDWLELQLGQWAVPLAGWAALAAGVAAALWQLRSWGAAQLALFRPDQVSPAAGAGGSAEGGQGASTAGAPGAEAEAAAGPFARLIPAPLRGLFEADWKPTDRTWLYAILAARLGTLLTAAACFLHGATAAAAAYAAVCFGASLLPAAVPHLRHLLAAPPGVPGGAAGLAAPLLAADAAFLLTLAPAAPAAARAAAAAVLAAGLGLAAVAAAASPRLAAVRAAPGDVATFHMTLRLPLSGTLIDSTVGHQPLVAVVGEAHDSDTATNPAAAAAAAADTSGGADPRVAGSTAGEGCDPQARFRPLQAALAATALQGLYVGGRRTIIVQGSEGDGGGGGGVEPPFTNPGLVWWQPTDDLQRKLAAAGAGADAREVRPGDVFWYPVGNLVSELGTPRLSTNKAAAAAAAGAGGNGGNGGPVAGLAGAESWGPVRVSAVAGEWVQLDANAGLSTGEVEVEVQLIELRKAAPPSVGAK